MSDEFDYFDDPRIGRLLDLVLQLNTEVHVVNQRLRATEALLVRHGVLTDGELDHFTPSAQEQRVLDDQREAVAGRLAAILAESGPAEHPLREQWTARLTERAG
ncbi:hypothetical protein AN216_19845 [Streptomyces oceani]|uniref:Uncharacterized protein n=2 Tax=Streptomyces oceani TaxID=1075402 RepID=A0A1E7JXY7_9ACTN|nr:hypothetical protein AN216_19845 [Streptomyces oceani]